MNVMLCILMLYLSPVDVWWTFFYLTLSLLYIYALDHYRFLRCTQLAVYADNSMDATATYLCAVPCALLAGSLAARLANHSLLNIGNSLTIPGVAIMLHLLLHICILGKIVPTMHHIWERRKEHLHVHPETPTYKEAASHVACSWFNANPVHCLRSKYIHQDDPPCVYFVKGKQHLIQQNEDIGIFFHPPPTPKIEIVRSDLD